MHSRQYRYENHIFLIGMILIGILYTFIRSPMLNIENSLKDWNSDYAIFVMMAEDIKTFKDFPFYYWGGNYLGPLNNIFMAITQWVMEIFGYSQDVPFVMGKKFIVGPLAASINCLWMMFTGIVFYGLAFKRIFSVWESLIACLLLSLGDATLIRFSLRPLGPEVAFFLGGLITWRGIAFAQNPTRFNQTLFGFLFGFSWWMNQITVFALVPVIYYFISQSEEYKYIRSNIRLKDRILFKTQEFGWKVLPTAWRGILIFISFLLVLNFVMGFFISLYGPVNDNFLGIKIKIYNGVAPMKTSIVIFIVVQVLVWVALAPQSIKKIQRVFSKLRFFMLGFAIGYGPVVLGKILGWIGKGQTPNFIVVPMKHMPTYFLRLITDFFPRLLLYNKNKLMIPFFALFLLAVGKIMWSNRNQIKDYFFAAAKKPSIYSLLWGAIFFNLIYVVLCDRSRLEYAFRYAILSLPIFCIFIVTLYRRFKVKALGIGLSLCLVSLFAFSKFQQGQDRMQVFLKSDNRMDQVKRLKDSKCEVFFSNYWGTYVFQYLLQHQKRFAVIRGQDRTPSETQRLKSSNLKKCDLNANSFVINEL